MKIQISPPSRTARVVVVHNYFNYCSQKFPNFSYFPNGTCISRTYIIISNLFSATAVPLLFSEKHPTPSWILSSIGIPASFQWNILLHASSSIIIMHSNGSPAYFQWDTSRIVMQFIVTVSQPETWTIHGIPSKLSTAWWVSSWNLSTPWLFDVDMLIWVSIYHVAGCQVSFRYN